jgi:hypothetical protein
MQVRSIFGTAFIWAMLACISLSVSKNVQTMGKHVGPDKVGVDEQQSRYEGLDLEDICKNAKNPYCKEIVNDYCNKSCQSKLCAKHGSVRGMCRLMCEAEDLPVECLKMGPSKLPQTNQWGQPWSQSWGQPMGQPWPQGNQEYTQQWNQQAVVPQR